MLRCPIGFSRDLVRGREVKVSVALDFTKLAALNP